MVDADRQENEHADKQNDAERLVVAHASIVSQDPRLVEARSAGGRGSERAPGRMLAILSK
jgi:hypothetical protein